ncbi:hypothetical protein EMCRGX_G028010 [Ephydatia muelleri]|eukprot:Em0020g642a
MATVSDDNERIKQVESDGRRLRENDREAINDDWPITERSPTVEGTCFAVDQEQETCRKSDSEELEYDEVDDLATAFNKHLSLEDHEDCTDEKRHKWKKEQEELRNLLQQKDSDDVKTWASDFSKLRYVAGVDISFEKENPKHACATLAVLSFPDLKVLVDCSEIVEMTEPYIAGFLAFREVQHLFERLKDLEHHYPHLKPQVILVDGNGILHPNGFGLACHLGVLSNIPCIGVAKKLYLVDGLQNDSAHKDKIHSALKMKGDYFELIGNSGRVLATAVRTSDDATNPVYVSIGHKISLETATRLTIACSKKRVPEPVRMADLLSRRHLREEKKSRWRQKY